MRLKYFGGWLTAIVLFSCGTTNVYQVVKLETKMAAQYGKLTDSILITSNHWGEGGILDFDIRNNSSGILRLDLSNSFLVKNNVSYPLSTDLDKIFSVAPNTNRLFVNSNVLKRDYFAHCDLKFNGDSTQHVVFNPLNTPISYYYFITLLDTHGNVYYVKTNNYYLSELYGISESAFVKRDYLKKCGNIVYKANGEPEMENIFLRYDENSFYFKNKSTVSQKVN